MAGRITASTERALRRHTSGEAITAAARAEGVDPSTVFRALKRLRKAGAELPSRRIVIAGAGNLGREVMGWLRVDGRTEPIVFLDDAADLAVVRRHDIIGTFVDYMPADGEDLLIAIADPTLRERAAQQFGRAAASFVAVSVIAGNCAIGAGSLLLPHCLVSADAILGACCIVNTYSSIGHDVVLGDYCTLSSHVDLTGHVKVGARAFFGSGARVLPGLTIGNDAVIGAGAVVVKNVPAGATVFGNPARQVA